MLGPSKMANVPFYYRLDAVCFFPTLPRVRRGTVMVGGLVAVYEAIIAFVPPEGCRRVHFIIIPLP